MFSFIKRSNPNWAVRLFSQSLVFILLFSLVFAPSASYAQAVNFLNLPVPGTMVTQSPVFVPVLLKGMTIHPEDPLRFDFIIDSGNTNFAQDEIKKESEKLVKYFLASMTIPKNDLWVNLSPYESDRVIPDELGKTELGRDMLAQDYILKQLTASLMYPEDELGSEFWKRVYKKAEEQFGTSEVPVNTFNKVWIMPENATVYENDKTVYVVESRLKVLLEEDYLALQNNEKNIEIGTDQLSETQIKNSSSISAQIVREIILPEIEKEVNEGKNFAPLRQIYHSLILSKWYKETIKNSLLSKVYIDQKKIAGVELEDNTIREQIYDQYMKAYKKGVFAFIKEDYDQLSQEVIPRKYFSGGEKFREIPLKKADGTADYDSSMKGDKYTLSIRINPQKKLRKDNQTNDQNDQGGTMGRWAYESTSFDSQTGQLTLYNATRIPRKDGVVEEEFLIAGENKPRDIVLQTRAFNEEEHQNIDEVISELGMKTGLPRVLIRDESSMKNKIYGIAANGIPFIREDIFCEGTTDQIKEAIDHERMELTSANHLEIRNIQYAGDLRSLITQLSNRDKVDIVNMPNDLETLDLIRELEQHIESSDKDALDVSRKRIKVAFVGQENAITKLGKAARENRLGSAENRVVDLLARIMQADPEAALLVQNIMITLGEIGNSNAVDPLIDYIRQEIPEYQGNIRYAKSLAAEALGLIGDQKAIDVLIEQLLGAGHDRGGDPELQAIAGNYHLVGVKVIEALRRLGNPKAIQPVVDFLGRDDISSFLLGLKAGEFEDLNYSALFALRDLGASPSQLREAYRNLPNSGQMGYTKRTTLEYIGVSQADVDALKEQESFYRNEFEGTSPTIVHHTRLTPIEGDVGTEQPNPEYKFASERLKNSARSVRFLERKVNAFDKGVVLAATREKSAGNQADIEQIENEIKLEVEAQIGKAGHILKATLDQIRKRFPEVSRIIEDIYPDVLVEIIHGERVSPVHHIAHTLAYMAEIAERENLTESETKIVLLSILFHDVGQGRSQLRKIVESKIDAESSEERKSFLREQSKRQRLEHAEMGTEIASEVLQPYRNANPESITDDEYDQIQHIIKHHDDVKISLLVPEEERAQWLFRSDEEHRLLRLHWEADTLWMDSYDGINYDMYRSGASARPPLAQLGYNISLHKKLTGVFRDTLDKAEYDKYGFQEGTLYHSEAGYAVFDRLREEQFDRFVAEANTRDIPDLTPWDLHLGLIQEDNESDEDFRSRVGIQWRHYQENKGIQVLLNDIYPAVENRSDFNEKQKNELKDIIKYSLIHSLDKFDESNIDNPFHHSLVVVSLVLRIAEEAGLSYEDTRKLVLVAILHDLGFADSSLSRVKSSDIDDLIRKEAPQDEIGKLVKRAIEARTEHMGHSARITYDVLAGINKHLYEDSQFSEDDVREISRIVALHDNPGIGKYLLKYQNFVSGDIKKWMFLLEGERADPLSVYFREADRLWMLTEEGLVKDQMDQFLAGKQVKSANEQLANNTEQFYSEYEPYNKLGVEQSLFYPREESQADSMEEERKTLFRTEAGFNLFEHLVANWKHKISEHERNVIKGSSPVVGTSDVGGIDLNEIEVERKGSGVDIQFDPAIIQPILDLGIDGFAPVIINLTPINSIMPLLGLDKTEPQKPNKRISRIDPYLSDEPRKEKEFEVSQLN